VPLTGVQIEPRISEILLRKNQQWNGGAQSEAKVMSPKLRRLLLAQNVVPTAQTRRSVGH